MNGTGQLRLARPARRVFIAALVLYVAIAAWLLWRASVLEAYSDMLDWAARWLRLQADHDVVRYLWAPHNVHHLVITLGALDLDARLFGGQGYLLVAIGAACLAGTAAMLTRLAARAAGPGLRLVGGGVALALCLMGCHVLDANAVIDTTYVHALAFAVAAIVLAAEASPKRRIGALACAILAGLGSAAGLAVWPALLFQAWRGGGRRGWLFAVLAAGLAFAALYLVGEGLGHGGAGLGHGDGLSPMKSALLALNVLGLPWMRAAPILGAPIGLALLAAAATALLTRGRSRATRAEQAALALILFSLGTAAMAGLARTADMTPAMVPMRYSVFLIPLHVGLWILILPLVRRAWIARPGMASAAVAALAALLLVHQAVMALFAVRTGDAILRAVADYRQGVRSPAVMAVIHPDSERARVVSTELRRRGLYQSELRRDPP